jgi:hypothetical protein
MKGEKKQWWTVINSAWILVIKVKQPKLNKNAICKTVEKWKDIFKEINQLLPSFFFFPLCMRCVALKRDLQQWHKNTRTLPMLSGPEKKMFVTVTQFTKWLTPGMKDAQVGQRRKFVGCLLSILQNSFGWQSKITSFQKSSLSLFYIYFNHPLLFIVNVISTLLSTLAVLRDSINL